MNITLQEQMNRLIYAHPASPEPTRYEMIRFSTWRIYFYHEFDCLSPERIEVLKMNDHSWIEKFPNLVSNKEELQFYSDLLVDIRKQQTARQDNISHFLCRMLYCQDTANLSKFVEMEKQILSIRLHRKFKASKTRQMELFKLMLSHFLGLSPRSFDVSPQDWTKYNSKIILFDKKKETTIQDFALVPLEYGQAGLRRRSSFVFRGKVYMNITSTSELVCNLYANFLRSKLQKMRAAVVQLINNDVENQISSFLRKTLQTLNASSFDETTINSEFALSIKNIEGLWKRFFPPCMMNLNQKLKQYNHLQHQGRRQLWLFLKGCGMSAQDNQEYFSKHFISKVSTSELKNHMYNIQHAYGIVGKKQPERPKNCRNIITGPAPKKDQHHGCPFAHWRKEDLKQYLRKYYNISEENLEQVIREKQEKRYQVACGRLFQGVEKSEGKTNLPPQITALLGRSPHEYFKASTQLLTRQNSSQTAKKLPNQKKAQKETKNVQSIEF